MPSLGEILLSYTPLGQQRMMEDLQNRRAKQYMEAAYASGQLMPQGQAGPPAAFANPSGVSPEFAARVAAIPGYEQLGAQLLGQVGAAGRDQAARDWAAGNMTMQQREELAQRQREFAGQMDAREREWQGLSAYQKGALGLQARGQDQQYGLGLAGLQQRAQEFLLGNQTERDSWAFKYPKAGGAYPLPGSKEYDSQLVDYNQASRGVDAVGKLMDLWSSTPRGWDRETLAASEPYRQMVIGALGKLQGTGALNEGDMERFSKMLQPPSPGSTTFWTSRKASLQSLQKILSQQLEDMRSRNPNLPQVGLPDGFKPVKGQ